VHAHALHGAANILVRVALTQRLRLRQGDPGRDVAPERIVGRGLVGDHVGDLAAAEKLGEHLGAVADQPHG
jgi:hypothetical protein